SGEVAEYRWCGVGKSDPESRGGGQGAVLDGSAVDFGLVEDGQGLGDGSRDGPDRQRDLVERGRVGGAGPVWCFPAYAHAATPARACSARGRWARARRAPAMARAMVAAVVVLWLVCRAGKVSGGAAPFAAWGP